MSSISEQCLLAGGTGVGRIYRGGETQYETDGAEVLLRIKNGVSRFPVLSLDSEGKNNEYFQIGFVGESFLEAVVFGPLFFPKDVLDIMKQPHVYIIGRSVHEDIGKLFGKQSGCQGVDVGVLTLDLEDASEETRPMRTSLGALTHEATGVCMNHIKNARKDPNGKKFIGVRDRGWHKDKIGPQKIVYAALDVSLPFTIVFRYLVHRNHVYTTTGRSNRKKESWGTVLETIFGQLIDRLIKDR